MILHRTILKELLKNLGVILFSMSIILFMEKFVRLTRLFMGKGADFVDIVRIFIYLQPSILLLSVPMAILITIFLTYGRMSTDSEIVVLKASGMGFWGIARASLTLSTLCFLLLLAVSLYLLPVSMHAFKRTLQETIVKKASMTFEAESFSDVFKGTVIYVKEVASENAFRGIFVYRDEIKPVDEPLVIVAQSGEMKSDPEKGLIRLSMNNGLIHTFNKKNSSEMSFAKYDFILTSGIKNEEKVRPEEIRTMELWHDTSGNIPWAFELQRRFALPFACILFGLLGPALSNKVGKIGRLGGFSLSLAILILYYMLLILGEGLVKSGKISPVIGGWAPDLIFGAVTFTFVHIAYRDKPIKRF